MNVGENQIKRVDGNAKNENKIREEERRDMVNKGKLDRYTRRHRQVTAEVVRVKEVRVTSSKTEKQVK